MKNKFTLPKLEVVPYHQLTGAKNMAMDEWLMSFPTPVLRFYGWEKPTLSFGKNHIRLNSIDRNFCRQKGIDLVRRLTGGRTVLHQHELTYTFIVKTNLFPRGVSDAYKLISQALINGLKDFGISFEMVSEKKPGHNSSICFQEPSIYELTVDNKKIVGSAQYRTKERILQHGSILLDVDYSLWKDIWKLPPDSMLLHKRVTSLKEQLGYTPPVTSLIAAIGQSFSQYFQAPLQELAVEKLYQTDYTMLAEKYKISEETL